MLEDGLQYAAYHLLEVPGFFLGNEFLFGLTLVDYGHCSIVEHFKLIEIHILI